MFRDEARLGKSVSAKSEKTMTAPGGAKMYWGSHFKMHSEPHFMNCRPSIRTGPGAILRDKVGGIKVGVPLLLFIHEPPAMVTLENARLNWACDRDRVSRGSKGSLRTTLFFE